MKRAFIMVLDSFGIGATEDAERFGDVGAGDHQPKSAHEGKTPETLLKPPF